MATKMTLRKSKKTRQRAGAAAGASSAVAPQSTEATITSAVAAEPDLAPLKAMRRLYPDPPAWKRAILRIRIKEQLEEGRGRKWNWHKGAVHHNNQEPSNDELERVRQRYGYKREEDGGPSRLYTMILADALLPLPRKPMSGVVSPSLLATTGIVPFSVFSTGPDIIQHYYDCIIAARKEVVLLTNYWQLGKNVDRIASALRELNERHQKRKQDEKGASTSSMNESRNSKEKTEMSNGSAPGARRHVAIEDQIIVKVMWDRGPQTLADLFRVRKPVLPSAWKSNGLPSAEEIPYLNMEILNYHRPLMGTFHAKLLLVDRQVALINSNNIQDRPNIEGCTRLEGDIVNSVYDHALISWGNRLKPPLPCLSLPAPVQPSAAAFAIGDDSTLPYLTAARLREIASQARKRLHDDDEETEGNMSREATRRMSFVDVVENVMRRENHQGAGHMAQSGSAPSSPTQPKVLKEGMTPAERERAARNAGAEWARKVLGERFHMAGGWQQGQSASAPNMNSGKAGGRAGEALNGGNQDAQANHEQHADQPHNRRHFADVVHAMMEKEGKKPGLWAEGALDAFGLGPSSSRNVADDARRSRTAAKSLSARAALNVPNAVQEEEKNSDDKRGENGETHDADQNALDAKYGDSEDHEQSSAQSADGVPEGTTLQGAPNTSSSPDEKEAKPFPTQPSDGEVSANDTLKSSPTTAKPQNQEDSGEQKSEGRNSSANTPAIEVSPSDPADGEASNTEGAPGSYAYQQRHRRTISTRSKASASERLAQITKSLDFANLSQVRGEITAQQLASMTDRAGQSDSDFIKGAFSEVLEFNPYIFHMPHQPVPIALVNRRPHGTPGHSDIRNAQDAAWLAGFRYAKQHIFIQSPTLNATPIKHAILHAARRHVRIELWLGLGFNDKSESMPFQGGTNEQVVTRLYRQLRREGKGDEKYLEVYWYTGKDMTRPLNAVRKQRNCHVKYAQFDGQVAIIGSGNQDTQSWYHSQEINIMVDSKQIVGEWDRGLRRNQSTHLYGKVDLDGIWRGQDGAEKVDKGGD